VSIGAAELLKAAAAEMASGVSQNIIKTLFQK